MTTYTQPWDEFDTYTADGGLGNSPLTNRDRLPLGVSYVFGPTYFGVTFAIKDNLLYYSKPKQPEEWPTDFFVEVSVPAFPLMSGVLHNGQAYVASKNEIYYIQGTSDGLFLPLAMKAKTGTQSAKGLASIAGRGIFHVGLDGIYLFSSGSDVKVTEDNLEPIFRGVTTEGLPGVGDLSRSILYSFKNLLYFAYAGTNQPVGAEGVPTNLLVLNTQSGRLSYYEYNTGQVQGIKDLATDLDQKRILMGSSDGFLRVIESPTHTADDDTAISWEVQSKDFIHPTRRHFPRWVKYDVDVVNGSTCTGTLLLDGASHQTHTVTGSRVTKRRLVTTENGYRASLRISGTGPATVHQAEFE